MVRLVGCVRMQAGGEKAWPTVSRRVGKPASMSTAGTCRVRWPLARKGASTAGW